MQNFSIELLQDFKSLKKWEVVECWQKDKKYYFFDYAWEHDTEVGMIPLDHAKKISTPCVFCDREISLDAKKCHHCGEFQDKKYKWKWVQVKPALFQKVFCTHCFHEGSPKTITKGSILIELILWCFMIIPWLIYSIWRGKNKHCVCAKCGSDRINKV